MPEYPADRLTVAQLADARRGIQCAAAALRCVAEAAADPYVAGEVARLHAGLIDAAETLTALAAQARVTDRAA